MQRQLQKPSSSLTEDDGHIASPHKIYFEENTQGYRYEEVECPPFSREIVCEAFKNNKTIKTQYETKVQFSFQVELSSSIDIDTALNNVNNWIEKDIGMSLLECEDSLNQMIDPFFGSRRKMINEQVTKELDLVGLEQGRSQVSNGEK